MNKKLIKNYFILAIIICLAVLVILYAGSWYKAYSDYKKQTPVIRGTLSYEITGLDFEHVLAENPTSTFYMCTSSSDNCRAFEKSFRRLVTKDELQDKIIYVNLSGDDISSFVNNFNNNYKYKVKLNESYPALVTFTDGKITGLIEGSEKDPLTIKDAEEFIKVNHIRSIENY